MALIASAAVSSAYAHDLGIVGIRIKSGGDLEARAEPGPRTVRITGNQEQSRDYRVEHGSIHLEPDAPPQVEQFGQPGDPRR